MRVFEGTIWRAMKTLRNTAEENSKLDGAIGESAAKLRGQNQTRVADEFCLLKEIPLRLVIELKILRNSSSLAFKPRVKSSS
jgi:hypothetical protein